MDKMISIQNLSLAYGKHTVLKNINLEISRGEYIVIIGGNGSGKSTLTKALLGLITPSSGSILIQGKPSTPKLIAEYFGYVTQRAELKRHFPITVREVIRLECEVSYHSCPYKEDGHLKLLGAEHLIDKKLNQLSGGELQKVMIARALVANPEIIIMDEPSNNLDAEAQKSLFDLIQKLWKDNNKTIIHITHDHEEIKKLGSTVRKLELINHQITIHEHN